MKIKKSKKFVGIMFGCWLLICGATAFFQYDTMKPNRDAAVAQTDHLIDIDELPDIGENRDNLPEYIETEWRLWDETDTVYGDAEQSIRVDDLSNVIVGGRGLYVLQLKLHNKSNQSIKGLKVNYRLPSSDNRAVYPGKANMELILTYDKWGKTSWIGFFKEGAFELGYAGGSAGYIFRNHGKGELLAAYDLEKDVDLNEYWGDEGLELDLEPGDEVAVEVRLSASEAYAFEVRTMVHAEDIAGSELTIETDSESQIVHVVHEIENLDGATQNITAITDPHKQVRVLPNSMTVNGVAVASPESEDIIGTTHNKGEVLLVEYDVLLERKANETKAFAVGTVVRVNDESSAYTKAIVCLYTDRFKSITNVLWPIAVLSLTLSGILILVLRHHQKA